MSLIVKAGKAAKKILKNTGLYKNESRVSYTRRIERIKTDKKICAMTFDDGPVNLPASPDLDDGRSLTDLILDFLKKYGAHATFDIVGTTEDNYPDTPGKLGSAAWGGEKFDHYPDIGKDSFGGAVHADHLVKRMLDEGHELANHGYRHIIFGKKPFVYGKREHFQNIDEVVADLRALHNFVKEKFGYEITLSRPPHYVDKISKGLTSYDAYSLMNYGYMAASYDGGGWLPDLTDDTDKAFEREVLAMVNAIRNPLENDPDFFRGQIIFGKDGYNMARRTPVAKALEKQLEILYRNGYKVVSVSELLDESPFADTGRENNDLDLFVSLSKHRAIAYTDNTLRLDNKMNVYEYAMLVTPKSVVVNERIDKIKKTGKFISEYDTALEYAKKNGLIKSALKGNELLTEFELDTHTYKSSDGFKRGYVLKIVGNKLSESVKV